MAGEAPQSCCYVEVQAAPATSAGDYEKTAAALSASGQGSSPAASKARAGPRGTAAATPAGANAAMGAVEEPVVPRASEEEMSTSGGGDQADESELPRERRGGEGEGPTQSAGGI